MYPDRLYELAFAFRKTKLWKYLYDSELFAVSLPDGQIGYCNVMGRNGDHLALALYVGNEGLDNFRFLMALYESEPNPLRIQEMLFGQNCLQCSFEGKDDLSPKELSSVRSYTAAHGITLRGANAFPQFTCYRPAHFPEPVSGEADIQLLRAALEAVLAIHERRKRTALSRLGFAAGPAYDRAIPLLTPSEEGFAWTTHPLPPKLPESWPEPALTDDLLAARLRKAKRRPAIWICDVVMIPELFDAEDGRTQFFPYTMLLANTETETAQSIEPVEDYAHDAETLLRNVAVQMLEDGVPSKIIAADERTVRLLKNLAAALKIPLELLPDPSSMDELEMDFFSQMSGIPLLEEDGEEEDLAGLTEEGLLALPDELFDPLLSMVGQGVLDRNMEALLLKVALQRS